MANSVHVGREEAAHGTLSTGMTSVPCAFKPREQQPNIITEEVRGGQDVDFSNQQGVRWSEWEVGDSNVYHDSFGWFLMSALGLPVEVEDEPSTVWTGTYKTLNDPESLSFQYDDPRRSTDPSQILGAVVDEMTISFAAGQDGGSLQWSASGVGFSPTTISAPTYAFSSALPFTGWSGDVTMGGVGSFANLISGSVTIRRNRSPFHTIANTQDPQRMSIGRRQVEFELMLDFVALTELTAWRNAGIAGELSINWVDALTTIGSAENPAFGLRIPEPMYADAEKDWEPDEPQVSISGRARYDSVDLSAVVATLTSTTEYAA